MSIDMGRYHQFFCDYGNVEKILGDLYDGMKKIYVERPDLYYLVINNYLETNVIEFATLYLLLVLIPKEFELELTLSQRRSLDTLALYSFKLREKVDTGIVDQDIFKARDSSSFVEALYYQLANVDTTPRGLLANTNDFNLLPFMTCSGRNPTEIKLNYKGVDRLLESNYNSYLLEPVMKEEVAVAKAQLKSIFYS